MTGHFSPQPGIPSCELINTGGMVEVDLNADLGEGETVSNADRQLLDTVTSASLACGFHAGNRRVMRALAAVAIERGVVVGAHVSFRDRHGFGRRAVDVSSDRLTRDIVEQIGVLAEEVASVGGGISYVKPHGALYSLMGTNEDVAAAVVEAVRRHPSRTLVAQARSAVVPLAARAGVRVVTEGFPDRGYQARGALVPRTDEGALVDDPTVVARRAVSLTREGGVPAVDGTWTYVMAETLCIHGDSPGAARAARQVRAALSAAGVVLRPFAANRGPAIRPIP